MKIGKLSIFLFLVIYSSVVTAFDTTILSQVPKAPKQTTKTQSLAETKSFAFTIIDDLPANYLGHSYGDLHRALIARQKFVTRGEYESTIDFDTRIARLNERPLVGTTNFRSRFAFTFLPNAEQFSMTYDPDLSALDILLKWARRSEFPGNLFSLTWTDSSRKVSSYLGRNAFNRSVRVSVFRNDSFYLVTEKRNLERLEKVNVGFTDASLLTSIPMQPNDARLAKLNLRWLVIGHLAENAVLNNYSHDTPEITDPYDRYNYDFAINLIVEKMWLYDSRTGNVYLRFEDRGAESPRISESPKSDLTTESILESLEGLELVSPVKQGITQELKIISKPRPGYTDSARLNNIEGTVVLNVTFLASGQIGRVEPLERLPDGLTEQAIAAAKRISFEPALVNGVAQTVTKQIEYPFSAFGQGATASKSDLVGISYGIAIQNSQGMRQQLEEVVVAGKALVSRNCSVDETMVMRFVGRDKITIEQPFTVNKADINDALDNLYIEGGGAAIIDAVYLSIENLIGVKSSNRKALVLVTNGIDTNSYYNEKQLFDLAKESKVPVFAIGFLGDVAKSQQNKAKAFIERLTKETGGKAFFPRSAVDSSNIATEFFQLLHRDRASPCR